MYWGTCVVFPQPVSPASRMTWWLRTAPTIWSLHHQQHIQTWEDAAGFTGLTEALLLLALKMSKCTD